MSKIYNQQHFTFKTLSGHTFTVYCETYEHSSGWGHRAWIYEYEGHYYDFSKRQTYYNRTWESFTYETVLKKALYAFFNTKAMKNELECMLMQVKAIAQHEHEKCQAWLDVFTKKYNALSDETKEMLRKKDIVFNTVEQAETVINTALMLDALKQSRRLQEGRIKEYV